MSSLKGLLPPAKPAPVTFYDHSNDPWFENRFTGDQKSSGISVKPIPVYLKRQGFCAKEFGDGGAFPEIHVSQYPLGMGKDNRSKETLPITVDAQGNVVFDAIVRQKNKIVYSQHKDLIPKFLKNEDDLDEKELEKQIQETCEETKAAIEKIVNVSLSAAQHRNVANQSSDYSKYIKYKPSSQQSAAFNSGAKERIVRMVEMRVDPLEPPKFRHKRVPRASGSPPIPVMHSPTRPVTVKDKQDCNIPPCISNWKNAKGYTIPLDKRLAADGRGLQDVEVNDDFAKLSEALYVAEQKAREAVTMRSKVHKEMVMKEKERKEQELRALAQKARQESVDQRDCTREAEEREEGIQREKTREERRRERERERRLEAAGGGKKRKITRDKERDISEKVALGMPSSNGCRGGEVMFDQRLFNQEQGMDSGFATDDQYNVYDKGLFTAQHPLSTLYKPKKDMDNEMYGNADDQLHKLNNTKRFKPDQAMSGTGKRQGAVEFDKEAEEDLFGLAQFACDLNKGKKP
ncbi:hypothetical protein AALP_AA1G059300 [Arabis alpina]|uniref:SKI-interacting protein SKIP SNW domain-containing protein n=1 Tax=Arabis alpina TaxID=50452 RepID=A0A087HLE5_ARAAL|nr:hypothetical protein AALP_AA1G059300 [Arabis alpina]